MLSTPHDMAVFVLDIVHAFRGKPARVLSPEAARLMLTKQVDVPPEALGVPLGMGLGVFIDTSTPEVCFLHPGHNSPGTTFLIFAYPVLGKGTVIAANGNLGDRVYLETLASLAIEYRWPSGQPFRRQATR